MPEQQEIIPKKLVGRELLTPLDTFRGTSNASITLNSGATILTSATQDVVAVTLSNLAAIRMLNIHMVNNERTAWMTIEFRDGTFLGRRLAGPFTIQPASERFIEPHYLVGRAALSSIAAVVRSAGIPSGQPPVSNGVVINLGFTMESLDFYQ